MGLIGAIIVGGLAGWLASIMMGTNRQQGCLMDVLLGIAGGFVGGFLLSLVGLGGSQGFIGSLITGIVGAVILIWIGRRFAR